MWWNHRNKQHCDPGSSHSLDEPFSQMSLHTRRTLRSSGSFPHNAFSEASTRWLDSLASSIVERRHTLQLWSMISHHIEERSTWIIRFQAHPLFTPALLTRSIVCEFQIQSMFMKFLPDATRIGLVAVMPLHEKVPKGWSHVNDTQLHAFIERIHRH